MDKTERLKKILEIATEDRPSTKEVVTLISSLIKSLKEVITQTKDSMKSDMSMHMKECMDMCIACETALKQVKKDLMGEITSSSKKVADGAYRDLNNAILGLEQKINSIEQYDDTKLEAKWSLVVADLQSKINSWKQLTSFEVRDLLESIKKEEDKLDKTAIRGIKEIEEKIKSIELRPTGTIGGSRGIQLYVGGSKKGLVNSINLIQGTGVTLSYAQTNGRNDITISAASVSLTPITITGTINDSNTAFTSASEPTLLVINGAAYQKTGGAITWTYSGGNITTSQAIGTGGSVYGL